jgi:DNA-binding MarR family transcriptional regulator
MRSESMEEQSKLLFGQAHRLAVMAAIAQAPDGRVNPTDLTFQLGLAQSAFQAPLRDLVAAGLLTRETVGRRGFYVRQESKVWDWILELTSQLQVEDERRLTVRNLRSS